MFGKRKKLITHNGSFHADDIFAAAALSMYLEARGEKAEIIRTRDPEIIKTGDYVFDVGGVYDEEKNLFDHHQEGGAGLGPYGIQYSSIGLVWKKFGKEISGSEKAARIIEKKLCAPIDAWDNGFDLVKSTHEVGPYYLQNIFHAMVPTWREGDGDIDQIFSKCVDMAWVVLEREIAQATAMVEAEDAIKQAYESAIDKRVIVLDKNYPFEYVLLNYPEPLYAVYPRKTDSWGAKAIRKSIKGFENRKSFPVSWGSKRDEELQKLTGVSDAIFCHHSLFLTAAKSKEGAIKLALLARDA